MSNTLLGICNRKQLSVIPISTKHFADDSSANPESHLAKFQHDNLNITDYCDNQSIKVKLRTKLFQLCSQENLTV